MGLAGKDDLKDRLGAYNEWTLMPVEIYDHPRYYDIGFGWDPSTELNFLEACFRRYSPSQVRRVLELGCGTGRLLIGLAKRGYEAIGVEINRNMIDFALTKSRQTGTRLKIVEADMADFTLEEKVDGAFCAIDTFRYLLTEDAALNHLRCTGRVLRPGGLYVIDLTLVGTPSSYPKDPEEWTIEREDISVIVTHKIVGKPDLQNRRTLEHTSLTAVEDGITKKFETEDLMRTYTKDEFESLLKSVGLFSVLAWYGPNFQIDQPVTPTPETERVIAILKRLPE